MPTHQPIHHFQCQCGEVKGQIELGQCTNHVVCYCDDCQAFAHYLKREVDVLDDQGGSEIVQMAQPTVTFTQGESNLSIMRLSPKGLLRWHTACCNTPVCNTLQNPKLAFVGFISSVLDKSAIEKDFGPVTALVNTESANKRDKPKGKGLFSSLIKILWIVAKCRLNKSYLKSAFFNEDGEPIVTPTVISKQKAGELKAAVKASKS